MKLLHTSDLHLGYRQYGFVERENDFYSVLDQIVSIAKDEKVDAVIIAGDLFDTVKAHPKSIYSVAQEFVPKLKSAKIRVYGIDGNHDRSDNLWLRVCGITPIHNTIIDIDGYKIFGINSTRSVEFYDILKKRCEQGDKVDVLVIHQTVAEMCGFPEQEFSCKDIIEATRPLGVSCVLMGDIHTYTEQVIDGVRFIYSGSTETTTIADAKTKSVSIIELSPSGLKTSYVNLNTRPFIMYPVVDQESIDNLNSLITKYKIKPFIIFIQKTKDKFLVQSAEEFAIRNNIMFKHQKYISDDDSFNQIQTIDRDTVHLQLQEIISEVFDKDSIEFSLVQQLLNQPNNVKDIVQQFISQTRQLSEQNNKASIKN